MLPYLPESRVATSRCVYTNPTTASPAKASSCISTGADSCWQRIKIQTACSNAYANQCQLTAISVGYRLAPENSYPAAAQDYIDATEYLVDHGVEKYGAPLRFITGESAGGCLSAVAAFHIMRSRPSHQLSGLILPYGEFDLSLCLPSSSSFTKPLLINTPALERFNNAYLPGMSTAERRHPSVSPLHEDLLALVTSTGKQPPPALFLCGAEDALLDDTLLMGTKWTIAGGEAIVKIYPGRLMGSLLFLGCRWRRRRLMLLCSF